MRKAMLVVAMVMVMVSLLVTAVMAEECAPPCDGEQIVVYRVDGRTDYWCNAEWAYITLNLMKVLRIRNDGRQRDYPIVNILYVDMERGTVPFNKK